MDIYYLAKYGSLCSFDAKLLGKFAQEPLL